MQERVGRRRSPSSGMPTEPGLISSTGRAAELAAERQVGVAEDEALLGDAGEQLASSSAGSARTSGRRRPASRASSAASPPTAHALGQRAELGDERPRRAPRGRPGSRPGRRRCRARRRARRSSARRCRAASVRRAATRRRSTVSSGNGPNSAMSPPRTQRSRRRSRASARTASQRGQVAVDVVEDARSCARSSPVTSAPTSRSWSRADASRCATPTPDAPGAVRARARPRGHALVLVGPVHERRRSRRRTSPACPAKRERGEQLDFLIDHRDHGPIGVTGLSEL